MNGSSPTEFRKESIWSNRNDKRRYEMKKYVKPSLTGLGLLRVVTQYSCRVEYNDRPR